MKLNLIIDGNYIMQKSVFVLFKLKNLYTDLPVILEKDFNTLSNLYYFNKIFFISDSKRNWRKNYYEGYKGKRKKNENIEWDTVYNIFDDFKKGIDKKNKCELYQIDNLEGDDIISYITKETNRKGYSNLIIANDSDLFQLIHYDLVSKYMNFMYNFKFNDEIVYLPNFYNDFIESVESECSVDDLFDGGNNDSEYLEFIKTLINTKKITEIDSEKELFIKIIGHNKDNIKSIYMKGNRGIGRVGGEKIYDFYKETYPGLIDFNSDIFKIRLIESVKFYKNIKTDDMDNKLKSRLNMNLKLVKLDKKSIPDNLYENMEKNILI